MLNNCIKIALLYLFFSLSSYAYSQEAYFETHLKTLDAGIYEYDKAAKKSCKIFYDQEADREFEKILMTDGYFKEIMGGYEYVDSVGNNVFGRENEAIEYCPQLGYVIITGGHGFLFIYDIKRKKEIYSDPSPYVYSPSKKYRLKRFIGDPTEYVLEEKTGKEYVSYSIYFPIIGVRGVYWIDDQTFYFLSDKLNNDGTISEQAYSATFTFHLNQD